MLEDENKMNFSNLKTSEVKEVSVKPVQKISFIRPCDGDAIEEFSGDIANNVCLKQECEVLEIVRCRKEYMIQRMFVNEANVDYRKWYHKNQYTDEELKKIGQSIDLTKKFNTENYTCNYLTKEYIDNINAINKYVDKFIILNVDETKDLKNTNIYDVDVYDRQEKIGNCKIKYDFNSKRFVNYREKENKNE